MIGKTFFFAGGGTGGHIYPALAIAEKIIKTEPSAQIYFFCSERAIDERVLKPAGFQYTTLPAKAFSLRPGRFLGFLSSFRESYAIAREKIAALRRQTPDLIGGSATSDNPVVVGVGGFVAAPVCWAAHRLGVPLALLNVDIVPGRANKLIARWADTIFVQFADTQKYFASPRSSRGKAKIHVVGCPLRSGFENPQPDRALKELNLDKGKKILLITGASSGSKNINSAMCCLLEKLNEFADSWQIVHLTGQLHYEKVRQIYARTRISHKVIAYYDDMPDLLAASDLVIGRSGAVSVAEYAAAGVPSVCVPYPYHKDRHQYLNAVILARAGAAVIVEDSPQAEERARRLWDKLHGLLTDKRKRQEMADACRRIAIPDAGLKIAYHLLKTDFSCFFRQS